MSIVKQLRELAESLERVGLEGLIKNQAGNKVGCLPYIGSLNGYKYYLGEEVRDFSWHEAKEYCKSLGEGWEMPTRTLLLMCYENIDVRGYFSVGHYFWSGEEYSSTHAWCQHFAWGTQGITRKTVTSDSSVRPVLKVKESNE